MDSSAVGNGKKKRRKSEGERERYKIMWNKFAILSFFVPAATSPLNNLKSRHSRFANPPVDTEFPPSFSSSSFLSRKAEVVIFPVSFRSNRG